MCFYSNVLSSIKEKLRSFYEKNIILCLLIVFVVGVLSAYFFMERKIHSGSEVEVFSGKDEKNNTTENELSEKIFVDVSGAVNNPGIYEVKNGDRVGDAVAKAGGASNDASAAWLSRNLNLSQKIEDSSKIYIPFEWEFYFPEQYKITKTVNGKYASNVVLGDKTDMESNNGSSESSSSQPDDYFDDSSEISDGLSDDASGIDSDGKVNVNTASSSELDTLPGIGPANAEKIISNRPYKDLSEFESKSGLYKSTIENIKDLISF